MAGIRWIASTSANARSMRPVSAKSASTLTPHTVCLRQPWPVLSPSSSPTRYSFRKRVAKSSENSSPSSFRSENSMRCSQIARYRFRDQSEEHTSELQSHSDLVCRLLLEKKKKNNKKKKSILTLTHRK